eukprot:362606-Chlamydomonas_euryale.AAC.1
MKEAHSKGVGVITTSTDDAKTAAPQAARSWNVIRPATLQEQQQLQQEQPQQQHAHRCQLLPLPYLAVLGKWQGNMVQPKLCLTEALVTQAAADAVECRLYQPLIGSDSELGTRNSAYNDCRTLHAAVPHLASACGHTSNSCLWKRKLRSSSSIRESESLGANPQRVRDSIFGLFSNLQPTSNYTEAEHLHNLQSLPDQDPREPSGPLLRSCCESPNVKRPAPYGSTRVEADCTTGLCHRQGTLKLHADPKGASSVTPPEGFECTSWQASLPLCRCDHAESAPCSSGAAAAQACASARLHVRAAQRALRHEPNDTVSAAQQRLQRVEPTSRHEQQVSRRRRQQRVH